METSILKTTKKLLQLNVDDTSFDTDVILHINAALAALTQLGVGPKAGFEIENDGAKWADFFGVDPTLNMVKTYVYLKVRLAFDPPQTGSLMDALQRQITETEWRLNVAREFAEWEELGLSAPSCTPEPPVSSTSSFVEVYRHAKE